MTSIFVVTLKIAVSRRVHSERLISNFFQYIFSQTDFPEKRKREKRIIETDSPGNRWTWLPAASNSSAANSRKRGARKGLETRRETQKRASGSIDEPARVRFRLGFKHRASRLEILVPPFSTRQKKPVKDFPFPSSLSLSLSLSLSFKLLPRRGESFRRTITTGELDRGWRCIEIFLRVGEVR